MDERRKVALITGASRGIGAAALARLSESGYRVVGTATTPEGAEKITHHLERVGGQGGGMVLNLQDQASVDPFLERVAEEHGAVRALVNNAGMARDTLLMRLKNEELDAVLDVNLKSAFVLGRRVLRGMLKTGWGRMVNVSSVVASSGNPGQTVYSASKAALEGFTRSLAQEVGGKGITVNAVAPGFIDTDMTREGMSDEVKTKLIERIPLRRMGRPEEVAAVVAFLCSDESSYMTGCTVHVNGGLYMA